MKWTQAQQQTIDIRDKNILVSAAAGSGKTAVLVERIKQLILKDGVDMDRFLITTFTNAAAAEMKERLEKAIRQQLKEPGADKAFLKKQLNLMPSANISTFHTFALEIIHRYFYLTDLEPGFKIGDDVQISIMRREVMDELFDIKFEEDYDDFKAFLTKYSSDRNENRIKENLLSLYNEMRSVPEYFKWAEEKAELLNSDSPVMAMKLADIISCEINIELKNALKLYGKAALLLRASNTPKLAEKAKLDCRKIVNAKVMTQDSSNLYSDVKLFVQSPDFNQMRATKEEKEDYEAVKETVSSLRKRGKSIIDDLSKKYFLRSLEEYDQELKEKYEDTKYLIGLLKQFEELFKERKREKNLIDFDDVMHYAIEILDDDMAASEYREKFLHIFIDEFQDSNMLQERIIQRIARDNNLFMVGDVKQSIYKFRLAEPEIFKAKYELYKKPEVKESVKIDLNSNFRSKYKIADTVNKVFEEVMEGYDDDARLRCGVDKSFSGKDSRLHIVDKSKASNLPGIVDPEMILVRNLISSVKGEIIYDVKAGCEREIKYSDIVVLSRGKGAIGELERYLNNEGIPAYGENTGGYFESVEIQVFINLLKIIDNTRQDIPLISVMRCPVFGFDESELAEIRISGREGSYYDAVVEYMENGSGDELRNKVASMIEKIDFWKEMKHTITLGELVRRLLYDTGYYDYCSGLPAGNQRTSNLRLLMEKAENFEESNYTGLYGFLKYVEAMSNSNVAVGEAKNISDNGDVVNIMTVHKSKGLEFPVVILMGAGKEIKFRGIGSPAAMHKDLGICLLNVNREQKWHRKTLMQRVIEGKKSREELDEEIRILYVALTRAMDQLIITGSVKDTDKLIEGSGRYKSFIDMVYDTMALDAAVTQYDGSDMEVYDVKTGHGKARQRIMHLLETCDCAVDEQIYEDIREKLSYIYPYKKMENVKSKYSVTELNKKDARTYETSLNVPKFTLNDNKLTAAEIGTVMHLMMEKIDFTKAVSEGEAYIIKVADMLLSNGNINEIERKAISISNIASFFINDIGKRAAGSNNLNKEKEFILLKKIDGADAIVQGIIDCFFEEDDGMVLVDYKNSYMGNISDEEIASRYSEQIKLYAEAVAEATAKTVKEAYLYLFDTQKFVKMI